MTDERRRYARKTVQDRAVIHRQAVADPAHSTLYCTTVDISAAGLQLKLKQALEAGERIDIVIHVPGHKDSFHLRGEARWSTPVREGKSFLLGIQIDGEDVGSQDLSAWRKLFDR
jgi:c-di-GMP-binding flagellar brake protein YcgR